MRGRKPTARLRTCQPFNWKMRWTVFLFDQRLYGRHQRFAQLRHRLGWSVVERPPGHLEPAAQLADGDLETVFLESLPDRFDQLSSLSNRDWSFFRARSSSMASP